MYLLEKLQSQIEVRVRQTVVIVDTMEYKFHSRRNGTTCVKCSRFERKSIIYPFESDTIHLNTGDFDVSR